MQVIAAAEEAEVASGPVRDHRPLILNHDDYLRSAAVPKQKGANYRNHEGVVVNARKDGSKRLGEQASVDMRGSRISWGTPGLTPTPLS